MKKKSRNIQNESYELHILEYGLYLLLASVYFVISIDVYDNTILKPTMLCIFGGAIIVVWCSYRWKENQFQFIFSPLLPLIGIYFATCLLSLIVTKNIDVSRLNLLYLFIILAITGIATQLLQKEEIHKRFLNFLTLLAAGSCAAALTVEFYSGFGITILADSSRQLISTFGNTTYFGGYLVMLIPFIAAQLFLESTSGRKKILLCILLAVLLGMLLLTRTRSAWIGLAFGGVTFISLTIPLLKEKYNSKKIRNVFFIALASTALLLLYFSETIIQRFSILFTEQSSFIRRIEFYESAWKAFLSSPVFGNGFGSFEVFYPLFRSNEYWMSKSEDIVVHAHNEYLEILSECGILGFVAFCALLFYVGKKTKDSISFSHSSDRFIVVGLVSGIVASLVDNLGNVSLRIIPVQLTWWLMVAALFSIKSNKEAHQEFSFPVPVFFRKIYLLPIAAYFVILFLYIPREVHRFRADRLTLDGYKFEIGGNATAAFSSYSSGLHQFAENPFLLYNTAGTAAQTGRFEIALALSDSLIKKYPAYPKSHLIRSVSLFQSGNKKEGIEELKKEITFRCHPQSIALLAQMYEEIKDSTNEINTLNNLFLISVKSGNSDYITNALNRIMQIADKSTLERIPYKKIAEKFSSNMEIIKPLILLSKNLPDKEFEQTLTKQWEKITPQDSTSE
ncbi:MAG: O-antigen ligase family protein [Ignavibacteriales bacterium]|nr:O-antigen ligase family protein [Ignavibacteriales bacterium]